MPDTCSTCGQAVTCRSCATWKEIAEGLEARAERAEDALRAISRFFRPEIESWSAEAVAQGRSMAEAVLTERDDG